MHCTIGAAVLVYVPALLGAAQCGGIAQALGNTGMPLTSLSIFRFTQMPPMGLPIHPLQYGSTMQAQRNRGMHYSGAAVRRDHPGSEERVQAGSGRL